MDSNPQTTESSSTNTHGWQLTIALAGVLLVVIGINYLFGHRATEVRGTGRAEPALPTPDRETGVTLVMDVEGDATRIAETAVPHNSAMTVLDAMKLATNIDDSWQFTYEGAGADAFLTHLGGMANEGTSGRNWQYEVNGKRASRSFGLRKLNAGDRVLWKFATFE